MSSANANATISGIPAIPPIMNIITYRVSTGSVSNTKATTRPISILAAARKDSRMDNQRPRIDRGVRSESHGNQDTAITELKMEEIPSRKIMDQSCTIAEAMGMIYGISPKKSQRTY